MITAPGIPSENGLYNPQFDDKTVALTEYLNAVVEQIPTAPHIQRANVLTNSDVGILPDSTYNVGYHMPQFDNNQVTAISHYESPNVLVTHTSFSEEIKATTKFQQQVVQPIAFNLRAPAINEGF